MGFVQQLVQKAGKVPPWLAYRGIPVTPSGLQMALNARRLAALRNLHNGRRCFVIGNGPSLRTADLDRLKKEITFASNKIYLAFDQTGWRPTYLTVIDEIIAENNRRELRALRLPKIYSWEVAMTLLPDWRAVIVKTLPHPRNASGREQLGFCADLTRGIHGGYTVLSLSLQAAAFMGIREVYLIGVDFSFIPAPASGRTTPCSGAVLVSQGECNHFHPDYRKPGETWTFPDLEKQREAFRAARDWFEGQGGQLLNASRETKLDVLNRVSFDELF